MASGSRPSIDRAAAAAAIDAFLRALGRDPEKESELAATPARVTDAFVDELCSGYDVDVDAVVRENAIANASARGIVMVRGIHVTTTCPHHLMPAIGTADVAFAPNGTLIGVGAVARVVHALGRRLVLQEALGESIVDALARGLRPTWVACRLDMAHACFIARGERESQARVVTVAHRDIDAVDAMRVFAATDPERTA